MESVHSSSKLYLESTPADTDVRMRHGDSGVYSWIKRDRRPRGSRAKKRHCENALTDIREEDGCKEIYASHDSR